METTVVRVKATTHAALQVISKQTGKTMQLIVEKAIEDYQKKLFWETTNAAYAALHEDQEAWEDEKAERSAWEATLSDGLEDESND